MSPVSATASFAAAALIQLAGSSPAFAQIDWPGYIDTSFTAQCLSSTNADNTVKSIVIQSDGKIVASGSFVSDLPAPGAACQDAIFRCGRDGALDATFSSPFDRFTEVNSLAPGSARKILAAGSLIIGNAKYAVARLDANGGIDPDFHLTQTNPPGLAFLTGFAVTTDGSGRIVYGGTVFQAGFKPYVKRLHEDGTEDSSFAGGVLSGNGLGRVWAIAALSNAKVIVGGSFTNIGGSFRHGLARLNENGTLDDTFRPALASPSSVSSIEVLQGGKLLVAGLLTTNGTVKYPLMRLNSDGSVDPTFELFEDTTEGRQVATGGDGRIYLTHQRGIFRFTASGELDPLYSRGGGTLINTGFVGVAVDSAGRALVGGEMARMNGIERRGLIRLRSGVAVAPSILEQPSDLTVDERGAAVFSVQANGDSPLSVAWYTGATVLGTGSRLVLNNVQAAIDGARIYCVVTNVYGRATSSVAVLRVVRELVPSGEYNGLFHEPNGVYHQSSGFIKVTLRSSGTFSASVWKGPDTYKFTGKFDAEGRFRGGTSRGELSIDIAYDRFGRDVITGTISDTTWTAPVIADRVYFNATNNPATNFAGNYTFLIAGSTRQPTHPAGHGAGTLSVDAAGAVKLTGLLADGTPIASKAPLSKSGAWPLYAALYRKGSGSVLGWIQFTNGTVPDLGGRISWSRHSGAPPKVNIDGFEFDSSMMGSAYRGPGTNTLFAGNTNGSVTFSHGNLPAPFDDDIALLPLGKTRYAGTNKLSLSLSLPKGTFSGSVRPPGSAKAVRFKGAILEKQRMGGGYFLGTNLSGRVVIAP